MGEWHTQILFDASSPNLGDTSFDQLPPTPPARGYDWEAIGYNVSRAGVTLTILTALGLAIAAIVR